MIVKMVRMAQCECNVVRLVGSLIATQRSVVQREETNGNSLRTRKGKCAKATCDCDEWKCETHCEVIIWVRFLLIRFIRFTACDKR